MKMTCSRKFLAAVLMSAIMSLGAVMGAHAPSPCLAREKSGITLRFSSPPVPQAAALLHAPKSNALIQAGAAAQFIPWRSPEQMHTLIAGGAVDAAIMALPTAAVLSAKGVPCKVLAVYSSPLWIVSAGGGAFEGKLTLLEGFATLNGKEIQLPFGPGNMPELVLRVLAAKRGVNLKLRHCGSAMEAANMLRGGRAALALLPEPSATLIASSEAGQTGPRKFLSLPDLWGAVFPGQGPMPTAALVMVGPMAENPEACALARQAFLEGARWAEGNPAGALALARAEYPELGMALVSSPELGAKTFHALGVLPKKSGEKAGRFLLKQLFALIPASVGGRCSDNTIWPWQATGDDTNPEGDDATQ